MITVDDFVLLTQDDICALGWIFFVIFMMNYIGTMMSDDSREVRYGTIVSGIMLLFSTILLILGYIFM